MRAGTPHGARYAGEPFAAKALAAKRAGSACPKSSLASAISVATSADPSDRRLPLPDRSTDRTGRTAALGCRFYPVTRGIGAIASEHDGTSAACAL